MRKLLDFMQTNPTGMGVVVIPLVVIAAGLVRLYVDPVDAVHLAQTELWLLWLWDVWRLIA